METENDKNAIGNVIKKVLNAVSSPTDLEVEDNDVEITMNTMLDQLEEAEKRKNYQDQVLRYLMNQEQYAGEQTDIDDFILPINEGEEDATETAREILTQLLEDVNNITAFKEAYATKKMENNQYDLFDLATKVQNFHISEKVMDLMVFRETLIISKVNAKGHAEPIGGMCLDVQKGIGSKFEKPNKLPDFSKILVQACADIKKKYLKEAKEQVQKDLDEYVKFLDEEMKKEQRKFLVHVSSQFDVDGKNAGSRITGWVDRNLHTLEEKRREYIESSENGEKKTMKEKQIFIFMGKKHFDVKVIPGSDSHGKYCYSFRRAAEFLGEAANFLLLRYLALVRFIGTFELAAIHIEGALCRNIYQCDGPTGGLINNVRMDLYKVYRTIVEECGIVTRSCTILSLDGRIMKHDWEKCDYVLQTNPMLSPLKKRPTLILHLNEAWKYDLQLLSKYLDKKVSATLQMKSYLQEHKEIGHMINDFVQNILQIKPENIIEFTKHFFLSYAPYLIPREEYFEKDVNNSYDKDD